MQIPKNSPPIDPAFLKRFVKDLSVCPNPQKLAFDSEQGAEYKALEIGGLDTYKCVCGKWHMTTRPCCPICGCPIDDEGWDDCGCFADIHWRD